MNGWLHRLAQRRARSLVGRLRPHLPTTGRLLDVGSGTGHNAVALQIATDLETVEADVVDFHVVGDGPTLFDGRRLPFEDGSFAASVVLFVFQYADDPVALLGEVRRVTAGRIVVLQSTYEGRIGLTALRTREFLWGRGAFFVARLTRFVGRVPCSLYPRRFFTRRQFRELVAQTDLKLICVETKQCCGLPVRRDLFVLESV